jgi:DNA-binding transcriptional ArsR family regulator
LFSPLPDLSDNLMLGTRDQADPPRKKERDGSDGLDNEVRHGLWARRMDSLTCDSLVTYCEDVTDDDRVFKALADPTRRFLLDRLFARDGRTLTELESELEMTRFGAMKHLRVLEDAGLVVTRRSGREKLHFLNPVPIRLIHDRWIDKYKERRVSALVDLKTQLEESA